MLKFTSADNSFDLQLFAEGEATTPATGTEMSGTAASAPAAAAPAAAAQPAAPQGTPTGDPRQGLQNPLLNWGAPGASAEGKTGETAPAPEPAQSAAQPEDLTAQIPDKFKLPDGTINYAALVKSYNEAEKKISEQGQQLSALAQQWEDFQRRLNPQAAAPQQPQPLSEEQIKEINEQWMTQFYENPLAAIVQAVQMAVEPKIQPLAQYYEQQRQLEQWNRQIEQAQQTHPDFEQLLPEIQKVVEEQGNILAELPNAVEVAYNLAKARQVKPPEQLLRDPAFRQRILQDEEIRNEILKAYAQQVKNGQPPVVIGNQPGQSPATPPLEIKTTSDAKKATLGFFSRIMGS